MTGFGRGEAAAQGTVVSCEMRSVNGKGLDLRLRLPSRFDRLEPQLKRMARERLARGNVQANLSVDVADSATRLRLDDAALDRAVSLARDAADRHALTMPDIGAFLAMRGVVEWEEPDEDGDAVSAAVVSAFEEALEALAADRAREGAALSAILSRQVDAIEALTNEAGADPSREPKAIQERLAARVGQLSQTDLDPERLYAEAAMLAMRADLSEEIDRLHAHVTAARELLASDVPAGRRLEFLAQEFAREANTLCAKSNAASLTAIGLELKVAVDQYREQAANVE